MVLTFRRRIPRARVNAKPRTAHDIEVAPKMEGYQMFTIIAPKKSKTPSAKHTSVAPDKEEEEIRPKKEKRSEPKAKVEEQTKKEEDEIF